MIEDWKARLGSKDEGEREEAIQQLAALGEAAIPIIRQLVPLPDAPTRKVKPRAQMAAVEALGRIGGAQAVDLLLSIEVSERRQQKRSVYTSVILVVAAALLVALFSMVTKYDGVAGMSGMFGIFGAAAATSALRKGAVGALGALKDPRAAGSLALAYQDSSMRKTAESVLVEVLPKVREYHVNGFGKDEREAIVNLLRSKNAALVSGALRAVSLFGGEDVLPKLGSVASAYPALVDAVEICRAQVEKRVAAQRDQAQLLRASSSEDADTASLLRPASDQPDPNPQQLLREPPS